MASKIPTVTFNNGKKIPIIGLGTWKSSPGEVRQAVKDAIDVGYRHIDGAAAYQNETEVGEAITAKIKEGVVTRDDLFVTSKLWNTFHRPDLVLTSIKKQLKDLNLDYLDLYLIHWPMAYKEDRELFPKDENGKFVYSDVDYVDTWKVMEEAVELGLVKSIGVSNFNSEQTERLLKMCKIKPVMNQVECHPYLNQKKLTEFCKSKEIVVTAYAPLGSPDRPWAKPDDPKLMEDAKLQQLATKYGKSPAQILLRWQIQQGRVTIPKTVSRNRLIENISVFDFELEKADMDYIDTFHVNGRACSLEWAKDHKYWPFHIPF